MIAAAVDRATFKELQDTAGVEFVSDLVGTFLEEAPGMLKDLHAALAAREAERFRRAAHSLKSNSLTFGARGLASMARGLELGGLEPSLQAGAQPLAALEAEYARVARELAEMRGA